MQSNRYGHLFVDVSASDEIMDLLALDSGEDISMDVDDSELLSDTDNDDECEFSDDEEKEDAGTTTV